MSRAVTGTSWPVVSRRWRCCCRNRAQSTAKLTPTSPAAAEPPARGRGGPTELARGGCAQPLRAGRAQSSAHDRVLRWAADELRRLALAGEWLEGPLRAGSPAFSRRGAGVRGG